MQPAYGDSVKTESLSARDFDAYSGEVYKTERLVFSGMLVMMLYIDSSHLFLRAGKRQFYTSA